MTLFTYRYFAPFPSFTPSFCFYFPSLFLPDILRQSSLFVVLEVDYAMTCERYLWSPSTKTRISLCGIIS
jgi:hypothetical protein